MTRSPAAARIFLFATLDVLAMCVVLPTWQTHSAWLQGGDPNAAQVALSLLSMVSGGVQLLAAPVIGALSDRFGRRPILLAHTLARGLGCAILASEPSYTALLVSALLSGLSLASVTIATQASIADVTPGPARAATFGKLAAALGLGGVVGAGMGYALAGTDLGRPPVLAAVLSLGNFAYALRFLPESLSRAARAPLRWREASPWGSLAVLRRHPGLFILGVADAFLTIGAATMSPELLWYAFQISAWEPARALGALCLGVTCTLMVWLRLTDIAVQRFGARVTLRLGLAGGAAGLLMFSLAGPTSAWAALGVPLVALAGLIGPVLSSMLTGGVGADAQGRLQGALGTLTGCAALVGAALALPLYVAFALPDSILPAATPVLFTAFFLTGSLALTWFGARDPAVREAA